MIKQLTWSVVVAFAVMGSICYALTLNQVIRHMGGVWMKTSLIWVLMASVSWLMIPAAAMISGVKLPEWVWWVQILNFSGAGILQWLTLRGVIKGNGKHK